MRIRRAGLSNLGLVAALLAATVGGVAASSNADAAPDELTTPMDTEGLDQSVPPALEPPPGNMLSAVFRANGVQVYQCNAGAWAFVEPAAALRGRGRHIRHGALSAIHFRGPSWESTDDGSLVEAKVVASSPVDGSIPELLLQATRNRGVGVFGQASYVQRLATSGGVAPGGACADGATVGVPYRALYRFFVPTS